MFQSKHPTFFHRGIVHLPAGFGRSEIETPLPRYLMFAGRPIDSSDVCWVLLKIGTSRAKATASIGPMDPRLIMMSNGFPFF